MSPSPEHCSYTLLLAVTWGWLTCSAGKWGGGCQSFPTPCGLSPIAEVLHHPMGSPGQAVPCLSIAFPVPLLPLLCLPTSPSPAQPQVRCFTGGIAVAALTPTGLRAPCHRWGLCLWVGDRDGNGCQEKSISLTPQTLAFDSRG